MKIIAGLLIVAVIIAIAVFVGGSCLQYVIDFWAPFLVHHAVNVPLLPCAIASFFTGGLPIPLDVGTWLVSFVI